MKQPQFKAWSAPCRNGITAWGGGSVIHARAGHDDEMAIARSLIPEQERAAFDVLRAELKQQEPR